MAADTNLWVVVATALPTLCVATALGLREAVDDLTSEEVNSWAFRGWATGWGLTLVAAFGAEIVAVSNLNESNGTKGEANFCQFVVGLLMAMLFLGWAQRLALAVLLPVLGPPVFWFANRSEFRELKELKQTMELQRKELAAMNKDLGEEPNILMVETVSIAQDLQHLADAERDLQRLPKDLPSRADADKAVARQRESLEMRAAHNRDRMEKVSKLQRHVTDLQAERAVTDAEFDDRFADLQKRRSKKTAQAVLDALQQRV